MNKILFILGVFSYSFLSGAVFTHNTDIQKSYEFDLKIAYQNKLMADRLARFQNAEVTQTEIDSYIQAKESSSLYAKEIVIRYTKKQMSDLNITQKDVDNMNVQKKKDWVDFVVEYVKKLSDTASKQETTKEVQK